VSGTTATVSPKPSGRRDGLLISIRLNHEGLTSEAEDRRVRVAAIVLVVVAAGCASQQAPARRPPIRAAEWKAVLNDWYPDRVVDHRHPCGAIVIARTRLAADPGAYSTIDRDLKRAEQRSCPKGSDLDELKPGMSDADVAAVAGIPNVAHPHCWLYAVTRDHPGRRVCFTNGRVTTLQFSVHG
jgi:hypothetical protein